MSGDATGIAVRVNRSSRWSARQSGGGNRDSGACGADIGRRVDAGQQDGENPQQQSDTGVLFTEVNPGIAPLTPSITRRVFRSPIGRLPGGGAPAFAGAIRGQYFYGRPRSKH